MKRYLSFLMLIALISCNNDKENSLTRGVTIKALTTHTRTSFDGVSSTWDADDKLQVTIGAAGESLSVHEFTNSDPTNGLFANADLTLDNTKTYDLYVLYSAHGDAPSTDGSATVAIGAQTQEQEGTTATHIAALDPLYGSATGVQSNNIAVGMNHSATVLRITIENTTGAEIEGITSLTITTPDNTALHGQGTIDFATGTIAMSGDDANSITVNIQNSGSVAASGDGSSFTVWAAAAPFTMAEGSSMHFTLTTADDKVLEYKKLFETETSFNAGVIMSTTIAPAPRPEQIVIQWGYLDGYTAPEGMPSCTSDSLNEPSSKSPVNKLNVTSGSYPTEYGDIVIDSDMKYAYVTSIKCIRFRDVTSDKSADIKLPIIEGYKLTQVIFNVTDNHSDNSREGIKVSIIPSDLTETTPRGTTTFDLEDTISTQQYSIHISSSTNVKTPCDITGIQLTYVLE